MNLTEFKNMLQGPLVRRGICSTLLLHAMMDQFGTI